MPVVSTFKNLVPLINIERRWTYSLELPASVPIAMHVERLFDIEVLHFHRLYVLHVSWRIL